MALQLVLFAVGLTALTLGADWLVTGASRVASQRGVSPLLVGLTIVAFGTSAPELVVTVAAALRGQGGLAVGNVMGSTVANVGLIIGIGAMMRPIDVHRRLLRREGPLMVLVLAIVVMFALNERMDRIDGIFLLGGFMLYIAYAIRWGMRDRELLRADLDVARTKGDPGGRRAWLNWMRIVAGLALLLLGAEWLVDSAVRIATHFNVPESVIGATLVAVGTSLPELASTLAAAVRGLGDIAIGNVIGSNIFNLGLVLGAAALARPFGLPSAALFSEVLPALAFCILLLPLAYTGARVDRAEGGLLLGCYAVFIFSLF
ncbi:MAG: calcium/sodium antiporter [Gemmatimonadota bacterium]|nr:calcium/sodium antiporter [Gemmatimonadota bacterium]